jgi:uncharacterized protein YydD (DUF2326 family)|tara:strand:+ start:780 stop:944 length:165 start_codon:yes stop_codon:yes gene_type:complete
MNTVKLLENNVKELQAQLVEANKRILDLTNRLNEQGELIKKQQAQLSGYKNESI